MQQETITTPQSYAVTLANGLVHYATMEPSFASWLATHLELYLRDTTRPYAPQELEQAPVLLPQSTYHAQRRTHWLVDALNELRLPGHTHATNVLVAWNEVREREDPKAFLLGVDLGVLPVGIWGKMKIKREPLNVLIRADLAHANPLALTRTITTLTHRVIEQGLIDAQGHTAKLEPELGDWLFGDKQLALYHTDTAHLTEIEQYLNTLSVPHATESDERGIAVLAASPVVYVWDLPGGERLTAAE